jgi:hypothetical protein
MAEFTKEELEAEAAGPEDVIEQPQEQPGQARDEQGRFASGEQDDRPDRNVPYAALKGERQEHRETKAALAAAQEQLKAIAEMRQRIMAQQPQQVEPTPQESDPTGVEYLRKRLDQVEGDLHQRTQADANTVAQSQRLQVITDSLAQSEAAFKAQTPDYDQAVSHLLQMRARQLHLLGVGPSQIDGMLREEAAELAETAIQSNRDPAMLVYEYAKMYGYNGQAQQQGNPMFEAIARGQQSKSLSAARGSPANDPNANAVANMSEAEFEQAMRDPKFAQLVAGLG